MKSRTINLAASLISLVMIAAGIPESRGAVPYWSGANGTNWSSSNNWSQTSAYPGIPYAIANGDQLKWSTFSTHNTTSYNDIVGLSVANIIFELLAGPVVLNGNELTVTGEIKSAGVISIYNLPLKLNAVGIFWPNVGGTQTFNGVISESGGARGINFKTGTIILNGTNTYSGNNIVGALAGEATVIINTLAGTNVAQSLGTKGSVQFGQDGNGTVVYTGGAAVTDKGFQVGKSSAASTTEGGFYNEGSGAVVWAGNQIKAINNAQSLTFKLGGSNTNNNDWKSAIADNSAAFTGRVCVSKTGTGKWMLSGSNTYSGPTTVSNGTLLINGFLSGAGSNVTVFSGAALGGTGTVSRTVEIKSGGVLAPGVSVGTLTVTGTVTLAENAAYKWEYKDGAGDLVAVRGTLTLPAVATVIVSQVSGDLPATPTLFTFYSRGDANPLDAWVVQGLTGYKAALQGGSVILSRTGARGTLMVVR